MKSLLNYSLILLLFILTSSQAEISNLKPIESAVAGKETSLLNYQERDGLTYIDEQTLHDRYQNAKPIYKNKKTGVLHFVQNELNLQRLRNHSYIWNPELLSPIERLEKILTIETYHAYDSPSLFKPSIAQVLTQIPSQLLGQKIFFEITLPDDAQLKNQKCIRLGFHCAKTIFYRRKD